DLLLINGTKLRPIAVESFYQWIQQAVRENRPWDQMGRGVLTATGDAKAQGATNLAAIRQRPAAPKEQARQAVVGPATGRGRRRPVMAAARCMLLRRENCCSPAATNPTRRRHWMPSRSISMLPVIAATRLPTG